MKKTIKEELYLTVDIETLLYGDLKGVAQGILDLENRLKAECQPLILDPNKYSDFEIALEREYYGYDDNSYRFRIWGIRLETDDEYKYRLNKEKREKEAAERKARDKEKKIKEKRKQDKIKEKELYLELKKKYDKKGI